MTYGYNELGQAKTFSETVNGANQVTGIHHNGNGQVTGIDMPNTTSTVISYNTANQPTAVSYWNSSGKQDQWNFGFDGVGNLTSMQNQSATPPTTYGYDANNQLTSVTEPVTGGSNTEQFTLDPNGNPTTSTVQLGSSTGPSWSLGNAWDIAGNLRSVTDGSQTQYFEYDDHGNVVKFTDSGTGQAEYFSYNPDQQVSRVTFKGNSTTGNANDLSYLYDADGRITKITNNTNATSITFTYNALGELAQETTWDGRTIAYTYDNVGNRTSMSVTQNGTTTTTAYGYTTEKNRLTSITVGSNPAQTVTFDGAGNTLSDGTNTYTWNAAGQLASVAHGGTTYNYTYDGLDRRVTNSVSGYTYHYSGQSTQIAYITDANNNLVARFSYGAANGPAYMTLANGKVYRYVYDGQGDVVGLVDASTGSEVVTYGYDAWGNEIASLTSDNSGTNAGTINPFTYRGYVYDSQTGLYDLNARYYNPATGRFLSEDPVTPNASDALSNNEYAYAENNPVNLVDPSGTAPYSVYVNARFGIKVNGFTRNDAITLWNYFKVPAWFFRDFILANPDLSLLRIGDVWLAYKGTAEVTATQSVANEVATRLGGQVEKLKGNSWRVTVDNGNKPIVIRVMQEGSGGRPNPYFRVSIDGRGSYMLEGQVSSNRGITHIDLTPQSADQIINIVNRITGR
ncbi:MAG: RHS repeat-associated core domain-containing protein [Bacilli bacterium]